MAQLYKIESRSGSQIDTEPKRNGKSRHEVDTGAQPFISCDSHTPAALLAAPAVPTAPTELFAPSQPTL